MEKNQGKQKKPVQSADTRTLKRIAQAFKPYTWRVILVLIAILSTTLIGLVNPLLIQHVFDDAILKRNLHLLLIYIAVMIITPILTAFIGMGQTYLNSEIGQHIMRDLRSRLYQHLQSMPLHFFTNTRTGEIQSRLLNDVGGIENTLTYTAATLIMNVSAAASIVIAMFVLSPLLTLISLMMLPFFLWITYKTGVARRMTVKETQKSMAALTAITQETLSISGILLVKTFGKQQYVQHQFDQENQKLSRLGIRQQLVGRWFFLLINIFFAFLPAITYLVGGFLYIRYNQISFGTIVAFTTLQSRFLTPIIQLFNIQVDIQGALAFFERIFGYMDLPIDIQDKPDALHLRPAEIRGSLSFRHVTFTYKSDEQEETQEIPSSAEAASAQRIRPIFPQLLIPTGANKPPTTLTDISLEVQPGQLVALVGPSGAGKTTITYLIPRLYDTDSGTVEIDGYNVRDIALSSLGEIIGMVTQEAFLFHASIRENLLYARLDATEEEMVAAAKAAAIHERIMELQDGYETIVGERGYKLSGGEKQRVAIARVILKNPPILILDEATSALDSHSERLVHTALEQLMKERTTLVIAHRLSTILAADLILVIDGGRIVERGTHQGLLRRQGLYSRLYHEQFSYGRNEEIKVIAPTAGSSALAFLQEQAEVTAKARYTLADQPTSPLFHLQRATTAKFRKIRMAKHVDKNTINGGSIQDGSHHPT
jgi:ATP-binding cassette, subfamily B, bacterial